MINVSKCQFGRDSLDFLGHRITPAGIMPLPEKVDEITQLGQPTTVKGLHEFVAMVNFYRRFIPAAAQTMLPLFEALSGKPKTLVWNEDMVKAFHDTKKALADATLLSHPRQDAQTSLTTDASDLAVVVYRTSLKIVSCVVTFVQQSDADICCNTHHKITSGACWPSINRGVTAQQ